MTHDMVGYISADDPDAPVAVPFNFERYCTVGVVPTGELPEVDE